MGNVVIILLLGIILILWRFIYNLNGHKNSKKRKITDFNQHILLRL